MLTWLNRDGKLILASRAIRGFAYGFISVTLAIYLKIIGLQVIEIGILITVALIGSASVTFLVSIYADVFGRKRMLIILGLLMATSGIVFALSTNYAVLLVAVFLGTINVTGTEVGPFLSVEQAIIPQTSTERKRTTAFSLYSISGTLAVAAGALFSGLPDFFQSTFGMDVAKSFQPLFILYAVLALATASVYLNLSKRIETSAGTSTSRPILEPESKRRISKLALLFSVDAFAGGFVLQSIVAFWFSTRFGVPLGTIGLVFFVANILTAVSFLVAARIADRIGLIRTMVFTHIPSNLLLIMVPLAPSLPLALTLYLARMSLSQMDVPTRQSYTVSIVGPNERTAAAGFVNISRNVSQAVSPSITGYVLESISLAFPFLIGGGIKIVYDLSLYFSFRRIKPPEESRV